MIIKIFKSNPGSQFSTHHHHHHQPHHNHHCTTIIMTVTCDPAVVSGDLSEQPTGGKREKTEVAGTKASNENSLNIEVLIY